MQNAQIDLSADLTTLKERAFAAYYTHSHGYYGNSNPKKISECNLEDFKPGLSYYCDSYQETIRYETIDRYCLEKHNISLEEYLRKISIKQEEEKTKISSEIGEERLKIAHINNFKISEFMQMYSCDEISDDFIHLCLKKGYIESDYLKFIFGTQNALLDEEEYAFVRYNNYGEQESPIEDNFNYSLKENKIDIVIHDIYTDKFSFPKILNNDLVINMMCSSKSVKKDNLYELLNGADEKVGLFFKEFLKSEDVAKCQKLIREFYNSNQLINSLNEVINVIPDDKKQKLISYIVKEIRFDLLSKNVIENVKTLLEANENWRDVIISEEIIKNVEKIENIKLKSICSFDKNSMSNVAEHNIFEVNFSNLQSISKTLLQNEESSNILNSILSSESPKLNEIIVNNLMQIMDCLKDQIVCENIAYKVLLNKTIPAEIRCSFVEMVNFKLSNIDGIEPEILEKLVSFDKIKLDIFTIYSVFKVIGINSILMYFDKDKFINIDFSELDKAQQDEKFDEFKKDILNNCCMQDNNAEIFKTFGVGDYKLEFEKPFETSSDFVIKKIIPMLSRSKTNYNILQNCFYSYLSLLTGNEDEYLNMLQEGGINLNPGLVTFLICNLRNLEIKKYLINSNYDDIDYSMSNPELYIEKILNSLLEVKLEHKEILFSVNKLGLAEPLNWIVQEIIIKNNELITSKKELFDMLTQIDNQYESCKKTETKFEKSNDKIIKGLECLRLRGIIEISTRKDLSYVRIKSFTLD